MRTITIVPYNNLWPQEFTIIAYTLRALLGYKAVGIHHIGSTSVPGLAAKDVIDVQVTVEQLDAETLAPLLLQAGFVHLPYVTGDHQPKGMEMGCAQLEKLFFKGQGREVNLHVRVRGRFNQQYPILFRDYLRSNPLAAGAYAEIKQQLAGYFSTDVAAYYAIKDPVCDAIMAGANEWAKATGWVAGVTDV